MTQSFFDMPLLNWEAPPGTSVIADRFWIYWAVAVPLTVGVLLVWGTWYLILGSHRAQERLLRRKSSIKNSESHNRRKRFPSGICAIDDLLDRRRGKRFDGADGTPHEKV